MTASLAKFSSWAVVTIFLAIICFTVGVFVGLAGASVNIKIDFCSDSTSGRYIFDETVRNEVCD